MLDASERLWIGTSEGLFIAKNGRLDHIKKGVGSSTTLKSNFIKCLFQDVHGSIWIGSYYGGLSMWDEANANFKDLEALFIESDIRSNVVSSVAFVNNSLWIGTEGAGLLKYDKNLDKIDMLDQVGSGFLPSNIKDIEEYNGKLLLELLRMASLLLILFLRFTKARNSTKKYQHF